MAVATEREYLLFINGEQFGQVFGGADLRNVFAPLRFGATTGIE